MTWPRIVVAGATMALTRRTTLRKAFLAPWHPDVEKVMLYALADAQRATGVAVHQFVPMVNHLHLTVTPSQDNLPEFAHRLYRDISLGLQALLRAHGYDVPGQLWDGRQGHAMRLLDAPAQMSHLVYERLNPVAAGLVGRPEHHPYTEVHWARWSRGAARAVKRPEGFFSSTRASELPLVATPSPVLFREFRGDREQLRYHLDRLTEHGRRALQQARPADRRPMGAQALRRLHPWSEPRTLQEPGGKRVPTFRIGARDIVARRARCSAAREVTAFRQRHREVRVARREGTAPKAPFPFGTYAARVHDGAPVEACPLDALVAQPGPLLSDVEAELASDESLHAPHSAPLLDEVRAALSDEASDIVEHADIELLTPPAAASQPQSAEAPAASQPQSAEAEEPQAVRLRHRLDPRPARREGARRLVVLRDRRRGRKPKQRGADPPR